MAPIHLKQARKAAGLSQSALAERSGVSQTYISDLETGAQRNPTLDVAERLARALGVDLGSLRFGAGDARAGRDRRVRERRGSVAGRRRSNRNEEAERRKADRRSA